MPKFILTIALIGLTSLCYSKVHLPAVINNNMVLQQKSKVSLWGHAVKSGKVVIITGWNNKKYTAVTDTAGSWHLQVRTPPAGGPFKISFNDGELLELSNILIGEVWVCSGQSNMEMPVKGYTKQPILNAAQIIDDANKHPAIRIFRVPKTVSAVPLNDCQGKWFETDTQTVKDFSAIAYQYAAILRAKLNVPVGIIATYWGGTAVQSWMSEKTLSRFAEVKIPERLDTIADPEQSPEQSPAILFNAMIAPIAGYGIKGFIWYQGESNRYHPALYAKLLPVMVKEWRRLWNLGNLPFYYVQIAPYGYSGPNNYFSAVLREVQFKLEHKIPHAGMVVALDAGKQQFIHPPDKTIISERLSNYALAETYHRSGIAYLSPAFKRMKIRKEQLYLKFTNTGGGLQFKDQDTGNFEIAGSDKVFYPAQAVIINKDQVSVHSDQVKKPVSVRYAFKNWCVGNLYTKEGMPASSFRTDNWDQLN